MVSIITRNLADSCLRGNFKIRQISRFNNKIFLKTNSNFSCLGLEIQSNASEYCKRHNTEDDLSKNFKKINQEMIIEIDNDIDSQMKLKPLEMLIFWPFIINHINKMVMRLLPKNYESKDISLSLIHILYSDKPEFSENPLVTKLRNYLEENCIDTEHFREILVAIHGNFYSLAKHEVPDVSINEKEYYRYLLAEVGCSPSPSLNYNKRFNYRIKCINTVLKFNLNQLE